MDSLNASFGRLTLGPTQPVPNAVARRPAAPPRAPQVVADTTVVGGAEYDGQEAQYQLAVRETTHRLAKAIERGLSPEPYDLMRMTLLLGYQSESPRAAQEFAVNAVGLLAQRTFHVHSALTQATAEMHVRLFYRAVRKMSVEGIVKFADPWQRQLVNQLLQLRSYAGEQSNPNTLFMLSCIRNCIASIPTDESTLAVCLRYGISVVQVAAAAAGSNPGGAASGLSSLADQLRRARLRPDDWYKQATDLEDLSGAIEWAMYNEHSTQQLCTELLGLTKKTLESEMTRLKTVRAETLAKLKQTFNRANIRQVDNEWDLAFACLDKLHANLYAFNDDTQLQEVISQIYLVMARSDRPSLRYKCFEILRDLRQFPGLRTICKVMLHCGGAGFAEVLSAVESKRFYEAVICRDIALEAAAGLSRAEQQRKLHPRAFGLGRVGSLRLYAPRFGARPAIQPAPASEATPPPPYPGALSPKPPAPAAIVAAKASEMHSPGRDLRLPLRPGEGLELLVDAVRCDDARELEELLRVGIHAPADGRIKEAVIRRAWPQGFAGAGLPATLFETALALGHVRCMDILKSPLAARGNVAPIHVAASEPRRVSSGSSETTDRDQRTKRVVMEPRRR